jgi:hypothetical protein
VPKTIGKVVRGKKGRIGTTQNIFRVLKLSVLCRQILTSDNKTLREFRDRYEVLL